MIENKKNAMKLKRWEMRMKHFLDWEEQLKENKVKIYGLVIGQCTPALRSTLKGNEDFEEKSRTYNALWLLEMIKIIIVGVDLKTNPALSLHD